jgi:AraC-like DNA-binding protein
MHQSPPAGCQIEGERAGWPLVTGRPQPLLRRLLVGDHIGVTAAVAPHRLLIPASAAVPLVIKLVDSRHRPPAFLHGAHGGYSLMEGDCARSYLSVLMAPLGAYRLLGRPVTELAGTVVDIEDVFGHDGRRLIEAVREQPTWPRRFAVLDRFLARAAERGPRPAPEVFQAWRRIVGSGGGVPIGWLADEVGWSHKHLISRFLQQVGLTPKRAARLVRFERVRDRMRTGDPPRWDQLAADDGYADQAHLIRDFRAFTGLTPTEYLRRAGTP